MASNGKLTRLPDPIRDALQALIQYVGRASGTEPTQEELAHALGTYFTLDELTNQINYLRKSPAKAEKAERPAPRRAAWRFNMASGPPRSSLARTGWFIPGIAAAVEAIRRHGKRVLGRAPSDLEIAQGLQSSFIMSEIKNQIVHARRQPAAELDPE
jgi:hypothetical protein